MSDYLYGMGYDAGAVVDMNNLAIGYFPRSQSVCHSMPMPPAQQVQAVEQQQVQSGAAVVQESETTA